MSAKLSRRKFISIGAFAATGAALAACAPAAAPTQAPAAAATQAPAAAATKAPAAAAKAAVDLTIALSEHPSQPILQDAPAHVATAQATGVRLNFQPVPSADYLAKQKVWMATKQVPDIMKSGFNDIRDYADPAILKPVTPLIDQYGPNLKKYLDAYADTVKKLKMNGELYIIPATSYNTKLLAPMPCIRKDLLDKIGMPFPDDFDKLYQALKELKKADPNILGWTARTRVRDVVARLAS